MLWGTSNPIQLLDPEFKVKINIRARGQYGLRIKDYQFLFTQLIGSLGDNTLIEFGEINNFFRAVINNKIKTIIAQYVINNKVGILSMAIHLDSLSTESKAALNSILDTYGMELVNFYVEAVDIPDEDLETINKILNKNAEFNIMGDSRYRTARGYDVLEKTAENEGAGGSMASAGLGIDAGIAFAKIVANLHQISFQVTTKQPLRQQNFVSIAALRLKQLVNFVQNVVKR